MSEERDLDRRRYIEPPLSSVRLERNWGAIEARTRPSFARAARSVAVVGLVVSAAAAAVLFFVADEPSDRLVGTTLSASNEEASASLEDGTRIIAESFARLEMTDERRDEVRFALEGGAARFDVAHRPERLFAVEAGDVEVRVVGTAFRVAREGDSVSVEVTRGAVDVRRGATVVRVRVGEQWEGSAHERTAAQPVEIPVEIPVVEQAGTQEVSARTARERLGPDELFASARSLRQEGDARGAARAYSLFLRRHPNDARASLVALELGRLRMDVLGDPRGAIRALRVSLRADSAGPFAADVRARLVEAYASAGDRENCVRARDAYLARHPGGRHAADVRSACE